MVHVDPSGLTPPLQHESNNTVHFLLLCIAKALQLQLRDRSSKSSMETTLDQIDANDWLKGTISAEVAREIVVLLRGLRDDAPSWMKIIDETIQHLMSHLKSLQKSVLVATQYAQIMHFWMVLAALWVVGEDQKLVSMLNEHKSDSTTTTKYCDNHEDGVTEAAYHCTSCQKSLCADCDRYLHLAKALRNHERSVIVADTLTVDVHEGCIRAKLSILFIIIDVDRYYPSHSRWILI